MELCVHVSYRVRPEFLKVDTGLRPTCWSYPWVDGCKEIIRNKEMLSINQLLPSMYELFFPQFTLQESPDTDEKRVRVSEFLPFPPILYSV